MPSPTRSRGDTAARQGEPTWRPARRDGHRGAEPAALERLQRTAGNRATAKMLVAQPTLEVGATSDAAEREADSISARVVAALHGTRDGAVQRAGTTRVDVRHQDRGVIRRKISRDKTWVAGMSFTGYWSQSQVDAEFNKLDTAWSDASAAMTRLNRSHGRLRRLSEKERPGKTELARNIQATNDRLKKCDGPVSWSDRATMSSTLADIKKAIDDLQSKVDTFQREDDEVAQAEAEAERLRQQEESERRAKADADALAEQQRREAEQEARRRAEKEQREKEEAERLIALKREQRAAKKAADLEAAKQAEAAAAKQAEEDRLAELERDKEARRIASAKQSWRSALGKIAQTTPPPAVAAMPQRFGNTKLQVAELEKMLVNEIQELEARKWQRSAVDNALHAGLNLEYRWAQHVLAQSNAPRLAYVEGQARRGQAPTFTLTRHQLWTYLGYPKAKGDAYAMPKFEVQGVKFHLSLTGNAMNDPVKIWENDPSFLLEDPAHMLYELFIEGLPEDKRIHATSEPQGEHVYYGDVSGTGRPIYDGDFDGRAAPMRKQLAAFADEVIAKLWKLKANNWQV